MVRYVINEDLVELISLKKECLNWSFEGLDNERIIVPKDLTHFELLNNFDVDQKILEYYYSPTHRLTAQFSLKTAKTYNYDKNELQPYSDIINGAYHNRVLLSAKLETIIRNTLKPIYLKGSKVSRMMDLAPYFKDYANGFEKGYSEFEERFINSYSTTFQDKEEKVLKVFEFLTRDIFFQFGWLNYRGGFRLKGMPNREITEICHGYEDGQNEGYFYKAWSIVFSNSKLFEQLFLEYFDNEKNKEIESKENFQDTIEANNSLNEEQNSISEIVGQYLIDFEEQVKDYEELFDQLVYYFENKKFKEVENEINCEGIKNKKTFGWQLKELLVKLDGKNNKKEFLLFFKKNVSCFKDVKYDENNFTSCHLYTYFHTKTK